MSRNTYPCGPILLATLPPFFYPERANVYLPCNSVVHPISGLRYKVKFKIIGVGSCHPVVVKLNSRLAGLRVICLLLFEKPALGPQQHIATPRAIPIPGPVKAPRVMEIKFGIDSAAYYLRGADGQDGRIIESSKVRDHC